MKEIKYKGLAPEEQHVLFNKNCDNIIEITKECKKMANEGRNKGTKDLTDIGDFIGKAIGQNTCKEEKDLNIWTSDQNSFIFGFQHGYSIHDGTH